MLGRPQQQTAPPCPDIQKSLAGFQVELAADVIQFGFLRLRQIHMGIPVIRAGIHAARVLP